MAWILSRLFRFLFWILSLPSRYCKITTCRRLYHYAVPGAVSGNEHRDNSSIYDCFKGGKVTSLLSVVLGSGLNVYLMSLYPPISGGSS